MIFMMGKFSLLTSEILEKYIVGESRIYLRRWSTNGYWKKNHHAKISALIVT